MENKSWLTTEKNITRQEKKASLLLQFFAKL